MTRLIVAVDGISYSAAREKGILGELAKAKQKDMIWGIKISDMLYSGNVLDIIGSLRDEFGLPVMADVKLHDIPSTMGNTISRLISAGANIVTIHCSSNYRPKDEALLKHIAGVTVLTSFTDLEIKWIYDKNTIDLIRAFSDIAIMNGYEYIVSSVRELSYIQDNPLKKICTGVRPVWFKDRHDQIRTATVSEVVRMGADYTVIGRPITTAENVLMAIQKIYDEVFK